MDRSSAASPAAYLKELPPERRKVVSAARAIVKKSIPKGYKEMMEWGMIAWSVPLSVCPETFNGKPLLYAALSGHNKNATLYLMSAYGHEPALKTLQQGFKKAGKRLNMGKCCIHFKTLDDLDLPSIKEAIAAIPADVFVAHMLNPKSKLRKR
jgi:hypothetical protein